MAKQKLKIFISMPFTGKNFHALTKERKSLKNLVEKYGFELTEQFIGYQFEEDFKTKDYDPSFILAKDKNWIKESDVVISDFTSPSLGTDCELVIAKELFDKKVYAVCPRKLRNHTWLRFYCDYFCDSIEVALKTIKSDFKGKEHRILLNKQQYDSIAWEYKLVEETYTQKHVFDPTLQDFIKKNAKDKTVLVLHCASGIRARLAKDAGAKKVIGVDGSYKQILIACEQDFAENQGIEYYAMDAYSSEFPIRIDRKLVGKVDTILGFFLLDHAMNKEELVQVIKNVYTILKPGGHFFAMADNPDVKKSKNKEYGVYLSFDEGIPFKEGSPRRVSIYQNKREVLHFYNTIWKRKTFENLLTKTGFKNISIENAKPNAASIKKLGKKFWQDYLDKPDEIIIHARK